MPAGGSCLLSSINLSSVVNEEGSIDWGRLELLTKEFVIYLNEILDEGLELHPLEEQRESVNKWKQIGLGIMGLGSMLVKMGIKYGSEEAIELSEQIAEFILNHALQQSALIAKEKGTYPAYNEKVLETNFFKQNAWDNTQELVKKYGLRNSQLLTIAPNKWALI